MQRGQRFDVELLEHDMAARGWIPSDLASRAKVANSSVSRFLSGEFQTNRMAKKLATALGYSVRRYLIPRTQEVA
jgi:transcriptional regulator with XRE-family HTH domain